MAKKRGKQKSSSSVTTNKPTSVSDSLNPADIAAAVSSMAQPVLMKLCRLCESREGPFLNIFGMEQGIAKKIDMLLPFTVSEYDDLPHKICFRCSAKVEELNEFVQKCIKTQENLYKVMGKKSTLNMKSNSRKVWEAKLNQSNMSNDDICNAVIQKAMEGIKNLPLKPSIINESSIGKRNLKSENLCKSQPNVKKENVSINATHNDQSGEKLIATRSTRTSNLEPSTETQDKSRKLDRKDRANIVNMKQIKVEDIVDVKDTSPDGTSDTKVIPQTEFANTAQKNIVNNTNDSSSNSTHIKTTDPGVEKTSSLTETHVKNEEKPAFDISQHISTIKVNGVGVLFQCKLCNRNFLKREVVMSHGCAKTGVPKGDILQKVTNVDPPKNPMASIKYINNKPNLDQNFAKGPQSITTKTKPRIGPASKVKKITEEVPSIGMKVTPREPTPPPVNNPQVPAPSTLPAIEVPTLPGMKSRYRLLPGPNNTFTLVEDTSSVETPKPVPTKRKSSEEIETQPDVVHPKKKGTKGKGKKYSNNLPAQNLNSDTIIDLDEDEQENDNAQPYPVGLFQAIGTKAAQLPNEASTPVTFTTPAMKKQSYTVVQTGNPSKLLISTKPQPPPTLVAESNKPPKGKKKFKLVVKADKEVPAVTQPTVAPSEDATQQSKDSGFFTFINVDPLQQPSYVLPTNNIIQESQISTSTPVEAGGSNIKDSYECSMCKESFTREKKLLAHIQSHYNKMDEQSKYHTEKTTRKRTRKS